MYSSNIENLLFNSASIVKGERVLIIHGLESRGIVNDIAITLYDRGINVVKDEIDIEFHGQEPPFETKGKMLDVDVILCLTKYSLAHTYARNDANQKGVRFLSLPDYEVSTLSRPALSIDFHKKLEECNSLINKLQPYDNLRILSDSGTDLSIKTKGREWNCAPGYVDSEILLASPPDSEINIAPVENESNGILVIDGSVPFKNLGLLSKPIELHIEDGLIVNQKKMPKRLKDFLFVDKKRTILAEFGIGLNHRAELSGNMLEDEGCYGTCHFGFGSNSTIGGDNVADSHIDFIMKSPMIYGNCEFISIEAL